MSPISSSKSSSKSSPKSSPKKSPKRSPKRSPKKSPKSPVPDYVWFSIKYTPLKNGNDIIDLKPLDEEYYDDDTTIQNIKDAILKQIIQIEGKTEPPIVVSMLVFKTPKFSSGTRPIGDHITLDDLKGAGFEKDSILSVELNRQVDHIQEALKGLPKGVIENDSYKYTGEIINGLPNGHGVIEYTNGNVYTGDFVDGKFHGEGFFTFTTDPNIDTANGSFKNDLIVGKNTITYKNGDVYKLSHGEVRYGENRAGVTFSLLPEGYGVIHYANGNLYEGQFGIYGPDVLGTFTFQNRDIYEGEFMNGKFHGNGEFFYARDKILIDAAFYQGSFGDKRGYLSSLQKGNEFQYKPIPIHPSRNPRGRFFMYDKKEYILPDFENTPIRMSLPGQELLVKPDHPTKKSPPSRHLPFPEVGIPVSLSPISRSSSIVSSPNTSFTSLFDGIIGTPGTPGSRSTPGTPGTPGSRSSKNPGTPGTPGSRSSKTPGSRSTSKRRKIKRSKSLRNIKKNLFKPLDN